MDRDDHAEVLRQWAEWGQTYVSVRDSPPNLAAVLTLIEAAAPRLQEDSCALRDLLERSKNQLGWPDPLLCDLGIHRWLGKGREEAYSDWLAWVLQQLGEADAVLRVLGVSADPKFDTRSYWVEREALVAEGAPGCVGRIDLLIHFGEPEQAVLGVEVKTWDESFEKQGGYLKSLQKPFLPAECVLVALELAKDRCFGFRLRSWRELSMALRREIARHASGHGGDIMAAMMLGFVGAIEQNLLEFGIAAPRRARDKQPTLVSRELLDYLSETLEVRNEHGDTTTE